MNLIHHRTSTKVGIFVLGGTPLDEEQMARRVAVTVATAPDRLLSVYTPEDILLQKPSASPPSNATAWTSTTCAAGLTSWGCLTLRPRADRGASTG